MAAGPSYVGEIYKDLLKDEKKKEKWARREMAPENSITRLLLHTTTPIQYKMKSRPRL